MTATMKSAAAHDTEQADLDASAHALDPRNPELVQQLESWMRRTQAENNSHFRRRLGAQLGYKDGTAVYRYLAAKPEGDLVKFETRLSAYLANQQRIEGGGTLVEDPSAFIMPSMFAFLRHVRETGYIGVGYGAAGTGKTCAASLYARQHKANTLYVHAFCWSAGKDGLAKHLATSAGLTLRRGETHEAALRRHYQDAANGMMFIVDNAQRLTRSARDWLADFLDFSGVPIALIGNPEIVGQWARCDQHKRRVALKRDVSLDLFDSNPSKSTAKRTLDYLLQQHLPMAADSPEVRKLAMKVMLEPDSGCCGAVIQRAAVVRRILSGGKITDPVAAFQTAETQLIAA